MGKNDFRFIILFSVVTMIMVLVFTTPALAGKADFGLEVSKVKVGDTARGWIATYGAGKNVVVDRSEVNVVYTNQDRGDDLQIRFVRSEDGGFTWERSEKIAEGRFLGNGVAMAKGDNPLDYHFAWGGYNDGDIFYQNYRSYRFRTPVEVSGAVNADGHSRSIAADDNGGVHIVFAGKHDTTGDAGIYYSRSADGGDTFAEIATLVDGIEKSRYQEPDVGVDEQGDVYVTWEDQTDPNSSYTSILFSKRENGVWSTPVEINGELPGYYSKISVARKNVCVAWYYWYPYPIQDEGVAVSCSTDGGNSWNLYIAYEGIVGDFRPDVAVHKDGDINVVWDTGYRAGYELLFSRSDNGGKNWSNPVVFDQGIYTFDPKIAVDNDGNVYIVFTDYDRNILNFTREK